ncbi:hypothetical protein BBF96_10775 [Anoxybacter fermentans]|uniref:Putative Se/S carrier protein-like domain-containing protein n=1 Tax=Anoxybacter fermentans TaxID=1323375 RepID=A0A3Q9HRJ1_9FIRM|nr:DUF3343 domain-containing protein [Anoxybacter fermentans]AZR73827.1 hypothetical protein BBF96_10775 [Anoxybacter fermentans]
MSYVLISFESPHHTIKADKILEESKIPRMVYPIPREISKDCGMGLRLRQTNLNQALELFNKKGILYKHIFYVDAKDKLTLIDRFKVKDQNS